MGNNLTSYQRSPMIGAIMNSTNNRIGSQLNGMGDDELDLIELIMVIWKYWKPILVFIFSMTVFTLLYSYTITPQYKSVTKFFAAEKQGTPSYSSALSNLGFGSLVGGGSTSLEIVMNILNSRRMAKDIIDKFQLIDRYLEISDSDKAKAAKLPAEQQASRYRKLMESVISEFWSRLQVSKDKTNLVSLTYIDEDPEFAAEVANFCVANLDLINEELKVTSQKPLVIVLDKAEAPTLRFKPSRKKMVIMAFVTSSVLSVFLIFAWEFFQGLLVQLAEKKKSA